MIINIKHLDIEFSVETNGLYMTEDLPEIIKAMALVGYQERYIIGVEELKSNQVSAPSLLEWSKSEAKKTKKIILEDTVIREIFHDERNLMWDYVMGDDVLGDLVEQVLTGNKKLIPLESGKTSQYRLNSKGKEIWYLFEEGVTREKGQVDICGHHLNYCLIPPETRTKRFDKPAAKFVGIYVIPDEYDGLKAFKVDAADYIAARETAEAEIKKIENFHLIDVVEVPEGAYGLAIYEQFVTATKCEPVYIFYDNPGLMDVEEGYAVDGNHQGSFELAKLGGLRRVKRLAKEYEGEYL